MRITLAFDVKLESGRNYSQVEVAGKLAEELGGSTTDLYMEDEADTHYSIEDIEVVP